MSREPVTVDAALHFAGEILPPVADCHADRCLVVLAAEVTKLRAQVEKLERTDLTRIAENYALRADLNGAQKAIASLVTATATLRADAEKGWAEVTSLHAALRNIIAKSDSPVVLATARAALTPKP